MRKILVFVATALLLFAAELEITSKKFEADEKSGITKFTGDVKVKHNKDSIDASTLIVTLDKNKKPIKYSAQGNAKFTLYIKEKIYKGSSHQIIYDSISSTYEFSGDVHLQETTQNNQITAQKVFVDQKKGTYSVEGGASAPAKFVFTIDDK
jgi:lipopolysaccharide export system protein LptA